MVVISTSEVKTNKMEDQESVKKKIQDILESMEYGQSYENTESAIDWVKAREGTYFAYIHNSKETANGLPVQLKNHVTDDFLCTVYVTEIDTVKKILSKGSKVKWVDTKPIERAKILNRLADEIERHADMITQIEIVTRGILGRDTRRAIPLFAQYFSYYSSFAVNYSQENSSWKPEGIAFGVFSNVNTITNLGLMLAPALAAGYNVVLQVGTKLTPIAVFLLELAKNVGIPEQVIRLIPSDDGELLPALSSDDVAILTLFVDLNNEKYLGINTYNKKILNMSPSRTPLIVFDDADLDSAATCVIESAWSYQGLLPWSVDTVLVQESVFEAFLKKLKSKLKSLKIGPGHDKMADISLNTSLEVLENLNSLKRVALTLGVDVYTTVEEVHTPVLFIGTKIQQNNILKAEDQRANALSVLPFRSIDEAVNLANNTRQGLAASVWTENIGIANEVAKKLKVGNVWINSHGLMTADTTFSPIKDSGMGYFGGREGFYEYVQLIKNTGLANIAVPPTKLLPSVVSAINSAKKAQESWYKTPRIKKCKILQGFAEYIDRNKTTLSLDLTEKWLDNWLNNIYSIICTRNVITSTESHLGYVLTTTNEPRGVVAIETKYVDLYNLKLVLAALLEGNSVILLNEHKPAMGFYKELSQRLPSGVLNLLPFSLDNVATVAKHREVNAYFGDGVNPIFHSIPVQDARVFSNVTDHQADIYRKVTYSKNVWSNVGKSSTCSL